MSVALLDRIRGIAADVLETPINNISASSKPETIEAWDSVHHLNLVLALEQEFDVQFEPEEIDRLNRIDQIVSILSEKLNAKE